MRCAMHATLEREFLLPHKKSFPGDSVDELTIRALLTLPELRAVEALQREVWGMRDLDVVPAHQMLAAAGAGGAVLGAFDRAGALVGFCYGFMGWREGRRLFYSHMAGVRAAHRGRGVGYALKRAQREFALARGVDWMVWTFDPLQAANAHLNLHRLGVRASRYYVDYYGEMADALNRGVESDRLEVDWRLAEDRGEMLMGGEGGMRRVEIPGDFDAILRTDPARARAWRVRTRGQFQDAFAQGYEAVDFVAGAYLLTRRAGAAR